MLWRWLGVRAVPHLPCSIQCVRTRTLANAFSQALDEAGNANEARLIREILSWPVEWSALHGIAEVKTPILKFCVNTDSTASKFIVRYSGIGYPLSGASGTGFPYDRNLIHPTSLSIRGKPLDQL